LPLSEKARIEVYVPALPREPYQHLLDALTQEFTYTFGGATIMRGLDGRYLSRAGLQVQDRVHLIYTDTPFAFEEHVESLPRYADALRDAALEALAEEAMLVVVLKIYHAEWLGVCSERDVLELAELLKKYTLGVRTVVVEKVEVDVEWFKTIWEQVLSKGKLSQ
jgi:hypothetical protein